MQVKYWFTFNEPASFITQAYALGFFAPVVPVCPECEELR